jgi:hypothetical protein
MNHVTASTTFEKVLTILVMLAILVVALNLLFLALRKGTRLLAEITSLVRRPDLKQDGGARARDKQEWHRWFAWRPVYVQAYDSDSVWVGRHWAWLKMVERRSDSRGRKARAYRQISR